MYSTWHSAEHRALQCSAEAPRDLAPLDSTRVLGDSSRSTKDLFQEGGQGSHRFFERRRNFVTSTRLHQGPKTLSPYSPEPAAWPHTACGRGPGLGMQAPITNPALPFCPPSFCSTECPSPAYQNFLGPGSKKISRWNTPVCGFL